MTPAEKRAYRAGLGSPEGIDPDDEDMVDAALLATPDGTGGTLWKPARLQDIYDLPARTLRLYMAYRSGLAKAANRPTPVERSGSIGGVQLAR